MGKANPNNISKAANTLGEFLSKNNKASLGMLVEEVSGTISRSKRPKRRKGKPTMFTRDYNLVRHMAYAAVAGHGYMTKDGKGRNTKYQLTPAGDVALAISKQAFGATMTADYYDWHAKRPKGKSTKTIDFSSLSKQNSNAENVYWHDSMVNSIKTMSQKDIDEARGYAKAIDSNGTTIVRMKDGNMIVEGVAKVEVGATMFKDDLLGKTNLDPKEIMVDIRREYDKELEQALGI